MKAEHRKELETNALAERVGRAVQGMKHTPQKRTLLWVVLAGVALLVVFLIYRRAEVRSIENSERWRSFGDGAAPFLKQILDQDPASNQAIAASYELVFLQLRESMRMLATNPKQALASLDELEKNYEKLARDCKDDKVLLPEALFCQAVIQETRIIKDDDKWKAALGAYKEVVKDHKDSAFGKMARERIQVLENKEKRDELISIYRDLRIQFVREERANDFAQPPGLDVPFPSDMAPPPIPPDLPGIPK